MAKKITGYIKLEIPSGKANPSPPIGPALGQRGLNIMEFCKSFNASTQSFEPGTPVPVLITVYADRTFTFILKTPPVSFFLKKAAKLTKGSSDAGKKAHVAEVSKDQILEIAKLKLIDMNTTSLESACAMIEGSALSMGIKVVEGN